ncbi:stage VI sporulation protein D [Sediminibacillus halophilus]|uniref:Stage VI sporulation protein D n=1 Tax=Sediminibacillus halophilus TaxID=482461 RepID=A0A1G9XM84_9BACI|nr:stage VI sporulation protein D [Sediminibacillus halophilus]SDM97877.1 stage VI sporulation protein D [Sediminibacillus halophilus]
MAEGGQSVFTFDLNESVWFKKGQEVDEMMGISLDPEISIQEMGDFVSIRGVIELKGEYFQVKSQGQSDEDADSFREHPSHRLVDQIEAYEDGVNEFFHHFPVEVSIPKYRVRSLDEVRVGIESFDYELPASNQLKLNASLAIHGVTEQRQESTPEIETETDTAEQAEAEEEAEAEALLEDTEFETAEEARDTTVPDIPILEAVKEEPAVETEEQEVFRFDVKEKAESPDEGYERVQDAVDQDSLRSEKEQEKDRWKQKTQSLAEFFGKVEEVEESAESSNTEYESYDGKSDEEYEDALESSEESSEGREGEKPDTRYLLNIFDNKEERYARLKMCIVQESDTLASLAEKYKVSPLHISKSNRLGDDDIEEGQILYIPVKK